MPEEAGKINPSQDNESLDIVQLKNSIYFKGTIYNHLERTFLNPIQNSNHLTPTMN